MKQTAVEWLIGELKKYDSAGLKDQSNYVIEMPTHILTELEEQAKEIDKRKTGIETEFFDKKIAEGCYYNGNRYEELDPYNGIVHDIKYTEG